MCYQAPLGQISIVMARECKRRDEEEDGKGPNNEGTAALHSASGDSKGSNGGSWGLVHHKGWGTEG